MKFFNWLFAEPPKPPTAPVVVPRDLKAEFESQKAKLQAELDKWLSEQKEQFIVVVTLKSGKVYRSAPFKANGHLDYYWDSYYSSPNGCRLWKTPAKDAISSYIHSQKNSPYFCIDNSYVAHDRIESIEIELVLEKVEE
jgi:hypothetical protein